MILPQRPILIAADSYQFLDTICGPTPASRQEWKVTDTLDLLRLLAPQSPLAVVVDLEARGFNPHDALELLRTLCVTAPIVLLRGPDSSRVSAAQELAATHALNVAGTLRRPLMMTALLHLLTQHEECSQPISDADPDSGKSAPALA